MPVPRPRRDEVLVKVEACSISPLDWKVQNGFRKPVLPFRFPHVPGELALSFLFLFNPIHLTVDHPQTNRDSSGCETMQVFSYQGSVMPPLQQCGIEAGFVALLYLAPCQ
jgi:hypothetical protein